VGSFSILPIGTYATSANFHQPRGTTVSTGAPALMATAAVGQTCGTLANLILDRTAIARATEFAAAEDVPAHCRVVRPFDGTIGFEVLLPEPHA